MMATGSKGLKVAAMKALELSFCRVADRVVVLTDGFKKDLAAENVSSEMMSVVPNGADVVPCEHQWHRALRLGYFGTMGLSQNVPETVEYAKRLAEKGFVSSYELIGEGAARAELEQMIDADKLGFLGLEHGIPMSELEARYASVDLTVVSLQKSKQFAGTIPSKIFQSFARGVPVLFIGPEGDASELVRRSRAGIVLCGSAEENIRELEDFASKEELVDELDRMSKSAVEFMTREYSRKIMAEKMTRILSDAVKQGFKN